MKSMKIKAITSLMALSLITTYSVPVYATPEGTLEENQIKYEELTAKINRLTEEIMALNAEIEPLTQKIAENEAEAEQTKIEIETTEKEIENTKQEIEDTRALLETRIREMYKSGGQANYLLLLFNSENFNDFFRNLDITSRLVSLDREIIEELNEKEAELDEKNRLLEERKAQLDAIIADTEKALDDLNAKIEEQKELKKEAEVEQIEFDREFLSVVERELIEGLISTIENGTTSSEVSSATSQLTNIKNGQLRSPIVIEEAREAIYLGDDRTAELREKERIEEERRLEEERLRAEEEARAQAEAEAAQAQAGNNSSNNNSSSNNSSNSSNSGSSNSSSSNTGSSTGSAIVNYAYKFIGAPYVWGGTTPSGFDCSGFTSYVYRHAAGIEISRTTYSQYTKGVSVSYGNLQPGDLVFTYGLGHVGIYVGNGNYIHAPSSGDSVKVSPIYGFYGARRIL